MNVLSVFLFIGFDYLRRFTYVNGFCAGGLFMLTLFVLIYVCDG